jgi:hypothetical protein
MKQIVFLFLLTLFACEVTAVPNDATGPNKVYIEQVGNTNTITLEQVGGTNNIGGVNGTISVSTSDHETTITPDAPSSSNYAYINGSSNIVGLTQHGDNNWAQYNIKGNNNNYSSLITGSNNKTKLILGNVNTNNLRNIITQAITGNTNSMYQTLVGNDITTNTTVTGNSNQITQSLTSTNGVSNTTVTGNSNYIFNQQQDSAGAIGHNLTQEIAGNYNSITTQQQGSNDTFVDIKTTGDNNTITVRTSSDSIIDPQTAIAR